MTGTQTRDYYKVLQVDREAHPEVIRVVYRTLLKVLGKHPDLGGDEGDAKQIVEAYRTLSDPERRRAYDQWLLAHGTPGTAVSTAPDINGWIRVVLGEYRPVPDAPFARSFTLVLEGPALSAPRLYVKSFSLITKANWPTIGVLCRAVAVARPGWMPSTDVVMMVARTVEGLPAFVETLERLAVPWGWNRLHTAVCAFSPRGIHTGRTIFVPSEIRRLRRDLRRHPEIARATS